MNSDTISNRRQQDLNMKQFQIRQTGKICVGFILVLQFITRICTTLWDPTITPKSKTFMIASFPCTITMAILIVIEFLLFKKKGPSIVKYSILFDLALLALFIGDWMMVLLSSLNRLQTSDPPTFKISSLYSFTSFAWRTLLVTLIVQKWYLKIIGPICGLFLTTGYAIYYSPTNLQFLLAKTASQLISLVVIVYCEDKVKWKLMLANIQQEKWMQVNNFILNSMPENIMVLDLGGEIKFLSDYFKAFMKKCNLSLETKELFQRVQDLYQQQYESYSPESSESILHVERMATGNLLLTDRNETHEENKDLTKVDTLDNLIINFKKIIAQKNLRERQFLIYNGKLKMENCQPNKSVEVKISFVQHFENDFIILILRDTTQRNLLVTLEETNKYKDQLLASVSHELRAPLNGNINLVESAVNSPKIPENIKENLLVPALRSSKFLLHLINDILDMSQIKEKKLRLVFQSGNLRETLKSTAQLVELQAKKKGIELFVDLDPHLPKNFYTDHIRTSQIVLNLLNNAIKFTREGSVKLHVVTLDDPRWVKISVEDSGIGMSQDNIKKLFSSYTHIEFEGRQKMNPTGVGLGLNIASNLAELLAPVDQQGINVVSVPGQGSVFSFVLENKEVSPQLEDEFKSQDVSLEVADELPVVMRPRLSSKIQKDNISTSATQFQAAKTSGSEPLNETCSCPKILVVDDNPFNTMAFETILSSLDVKCDSVYNGKSAIQKILDREGKVCGSKDCKPYLVVFMDQEMPEMSGAETVIEIKKLQRENMVSNGMKIVGCTAHQSKQEVDKFLEAGLDQCIHKPISTFMIQNILKGSFY